MSHKIQNQGQGEKIKKYDNIPIPLRLALIQKVYSKQATIKEAAKELGIKFSTSKVILQTFRREGRIGKKKTRDRKKSPCSKKEEEQENIHSQHAENHVNHITKNPKIHHLLEEHAKHEKHKISQKPTKNEKNQVKTDEWTKIKQSVEVQEHQQKAPKNENTPQFQSIQSPGRQINDKLTNTNVLNQIQQFQNFQSLQQQLLQPSQIMSAPQLSQNISDQIYVQYQIEIMNQRRMNAYLMNVIKNQQLSMMRQNSPFLPRESMRSANSLPDFTQVKQEDQLQQPVMPSCNSIKDQEQLEVNQFFDLKSQVGSCLQSRRDLP